MSSAKFPPPFPAASVPGKSKAGTSATPAGGGSCVALRRRAAALRPPRPPRRLPPHRPPPSLFSRPRSGSALLSQCADKHLRSYQRESSERVEALKLAVQGSTEAAALLRGLLKDGATTAKRGATFAGQSRARRARARAARAHTLIPAPSLTPPPRARSLVEAGPRRVHRVLPGLRARGHGSGELGGGAARRHEGAGARGQGRRRGRNRRRARQGLQVSDARAPCLRACPR